MMGNMSRFHIRSARPDEAGLFYTPHPEEDKRRGTIGHIRMDFGRSGNEFWRLLPQIFAHRACVSAHFPVLSSRPAAIIASATLAGTIG